VCHRRVEVHSLEWCRLGRRELGTWIAMSVGESCESLSANWFGKPGNTLEPSMWIHSHGSGVTLMLRLGTTMSMVGWNVLRLQPVGVFSSIKYKFPMLCFLFLLYLFLLRIKLLYLIIVLIICILSS
jgi:hypothetical protein